MNRGRLRTLPKLGVVFSLCALLLLGGCSDATTPYRTVALNDVILGASETSQIAERSGMRGQLVQGSPDFAIRHWRIDGIPFGARHFVQEDLDSPGIVLQNVEVLLYALGNRDDAIALFEQSPPHVSHRGKVFNVDHYEPTAADVERWSVSLPSDGSNDDDLQSSAICLVGSTKSRSTCAGFFGWFRCREYVFEVALGTASNTPINSPGIALLLQKWGEAQCDRLK